MQFHGPVAIANLARLVGEIADAGALELALGPVDLNLESAAGPEALDGAVGPGFRERGQELDFAGVALEQHLGDAGGAAEVAVDLERGMGVEHVGVGPVGTDQEAEDLVGVLGVLQPGPEVEPPGQAPAGGVVAANFQRLAGRGGELRRAPEVIWALGNKP